MCVKRKLRHILPLLIPCLAFQSCIFEDLPECPEDPWRHIRVEFDTSLCPDADPEGMTVFMYPEDGSKEWRFDLPATDGGMIDIPAGKYSVLAYNNDLYRTTILNPDSYRLCAFSTPAGNVFDGIQSLTRQAIPGGPPDGEQQIRKAPQMMWCGSIPQADTDTGQDTIVIQLRQAVSDISVEVAPVANITAVDRLCAIITGMAGEKVCHDLTPGGGKTAIPFSVNRTSPQSDTIAGRLRAFGRWPDTRNYLLMYVWLTDGGRFYYKFDVTDQIVNAPDPLDVKIKLGGITIPATSGGSTSGGGLDVGVDGWDYVIIDM